MAINYIWTCTACGAANAAGADTCHKCDCPAIISGAEASACISGAEASAWAKGDRRPGLGPAQKFFILVLILVPGSGPPLLWIFSPPEMGWWIGLVICSAFLILLGVVKLFSLQNET